MAFHNSGTVIFKKYVDVLELRKKDGTMEPVEIIWDDKHSYKIEKAEFLQFGISKAGGGKHWHVWIHGQQRDMYLEKDKWFIETYKQPETEKRSEEDLEFEAQLNRDFPNL
jgi:hypothetical protein